MEKDEKRFSPFGLDSLEESEKREKVEGIFSAVAGSYDLMNDVMSFGLHRLWKKDFVENIPLRPQDHVLDLSTGSGDIAIKLSHRSSHENLNLSITGCDPSPEMLKKAEEKAFDEGCLNIDWVEGLGEKLPFPDSSFDVCAISFGLRNTTHVEDVLREVVRVLKPRGYFGCLEFSKPQSSFVKLPYEIYSKRFIPLMGQIITGQKKAYEYLVDSIESFLSAEDLIALMEAVGLTSCSYEAILNGVVAKHIGWKSAV